MSSSIQSQHELAETSPPNDSDPFSEPLKEQPPSFLDENAPQTDTTPTIISKKSPNEAIEPHIDQGPISNHGQNGLNDLRGRQLAHFELIEPIGVGGMAAVLRARDKQLDRNVALKILPPDMANEAENVKRFHQEARAAARLDHENIARVFFCGEDQRLHFIAFEFVEGDNLRDILRHRGKLPVKEAVQYMLQISTGLAHAAERSVVHRDIKPSNIIITPDGRAKLVDMGLARNIEPHSEKDLTQSGVTLGTFDYISPEQALEPREADCRSDIYSLGCTFYHSLTGQAPVPEGTAARKLHHHQHLSPIDPRQLNPAIPDSVAAILARMMAKDPKDRYQRPEELVQHLLYVAQELGSPTDTPQGLLYLDAPLPTPPQKRLGLTIGLAFFGLLAALIILSFAPMNGNNTKLSYPETGPVRDKGNGDAKNVLAQGNPPVSPIPPVAAEPMFIASVSELVTALGSPGDLTVKITKSMDLEDSKLLLQGARRIILEGISTDPAKFPVISCTFNSDTKYPLDTALWGGIVVDGPEVVVRNLRFDLRANNTPVDMTFAMVAVRQSNNVSFTNCIFSQQSPIEKFLDVPYLQPLPSVVVFNETQDRPAEEKVRFSKCLFENGQTAVELNGSADITIDNCAFGPHGSLFRLRGKSKLLDSKISLSQCSALVVHGPVFRIDKRDGGIRLDVGKCLFSRPISDMKESAGHLGTNTTNLIHQTGSESQYVRYEGKDNCYYNLNAFWVAGTPKSPENFAPDWSKFVSRLSSLNAGYDTRSVVLAEENSPLADDDPIARLEKDPRSAFQIAPDKSATSLAGKNGLGVQQCVWGDTYPANWWDKDAPPVNVAAQEGELIVDPNLEHTPPAGHFRTLSAAIDEAPQTGAVILIKHNGPFAVNAIRLHDAGKKIVVRPYQGYRPVLTLRSEGSSQASAFRVQRGKLLFEEMSFLLEPANAGQSSLSLVNLGTEAFVGFNRCVITLKPSPAYRETSLAAVLFSENPGVFDSEGEIRPMYPRIELTNSLVRGEGTFFQIDKAYPYEFHVNNSLIVLGGTLVWSPIHHQIKSTQSLKGKINLSKSCVWLRDYLLYQTYDDAGIGLLGTTISASNSVFAADVNPLIQFWGLNSEAKRNKLFHWSGFHNAYCGFDKILYQMPSQTDLAPVSQDKVTWQMHENMSAEDGQKTRFLESTFDFRMAGDLAIYELWPEDVQKMIDRLEEEEGFTKTADSLQSYGPSLAQLQILLPLPGTRPASPASTPPKMMEMFEPE